MGEAERMAVYGMILFVGVVAIVGLMVLAAVMDWWDDRQSMKKTGRHPDRY